MLTISGIISNECQKYRDSSDPGFRVNGFIDNINSFECIVSAHSMPSKLQEYPPIAFTNCYESKQRTEIFGIFNKSVFNFQQHKG